MQSAVYACEHLVNNNGKSKVAKATAKYQKGKTKSQSKK